MDKLELKRILLTYISVEENLKDSKIKTLETNEWIYKENNKFYIGEAKIAGNDTNTSTLVGTNISIIRPNRQSKYIVVRNYYVFAYDKKRIKSWQLDKELDPIIIESAKNGKLKKMLNMIYENKDLYIDN